MSVLSRLGAAFAVLGLFAPSAFADDEKPKKPDGDGKPIVLQLDASKLPPELLKQLLQLAKPDGDAKPVKPGAPDKPGVKPGAPDKPGVPEKPPVKPGAPDKPGVKPEKSNKLIGLADAVAIAEKVGQGTAVKAERKGDGADATFAVEVRNKKGDTASITVDASGKVAGEKGK